MVLLILFSPTWTPHIKGEKSISTLEQVEINGTEHEVMIRGVDANNQLFFVIGPYCEITTLSIELITIYEFAQREIPPIYILNKINELDMFYT